jgi:hypothetical protein
MLLGSFVAVPAHLPSGGRDVPPGVVRPTTSMAAPRAAHSATALFDGRVLVAGGFIEESDAPSGAEIYDARTGRFMRLPPMITPRHSHTATTLPDGRVLITGGFGAGSRVTASAELFDPATNRFVAVSAMTAPRSGHVAVPLPNGRVLIAGGVGNNWSFLSSAEVFDPATGRFTSTGAMSVPRESHVGLRLADGRVLVIGGHTGRRAAMVLYTSAEAYDPATGVFRRVGDMQVRRHKHDAILLRDGTVLVTGGTDERDMDGVYDSTELFDPATGTSTIGRPLVRARYKHNGSSVLLPDGSVLIAGGASQAEMYDPRTRAFTLVPGAAPMAGQFSAVAPLSAGRVLITGGYGNGRGPRDAAWLYQP